MHFLFSSRRAKCNENHRILTATATAFGLCNCAKDASLTFFTRWYLMYTSGDGSWHHDYFGAGTTLFISHMLILVHSLTGPQTTQIAQGYCCFDKRHLVTGQWQGLIRPGFFRAENTCTCQKHLGFFNKPGLK